MRDATYLLKGGSDERAAEAMACRPGMHVFQPGKGGHLIVRLGDRQSVMPMHGSRKELKRGTVEAIKKQLGLK